MPTPTRPGEVKFCNWCPNPERPNPVSHPGGQARHDIVKEVWIGVDPGAGGGLACVPYYGEPTASPTPKSMVLLWEWFRWFEPGMRPRAVIEKVGGYISTSGGEETERQPQNAMFNFGLSYGCLLMALTVARIPYEEVQPHVWQKALGIPKRERGEKKTAWKARLKAHAQSLFPQLTVTLATADALLLAQYCRLKREGRL